MTDKDTSIVEIKTLEKEVQLLLTHYEELQKQSIIDIQKGQSANLQMAKEINDKILSLLSTIKTKTTILYPKGITNQNVVRMNNKHLIKIADKLHKDQSKFQRLLDDYNGLDGKNSHLTLQLNSSYYEYMFYFVIFIILVVYAFKFYGDHDMVDMIILICAVLLLVYHYIGSFIDYGSNGIKYTIRKFMDAIHLL
jgi:hypothetical protein